MDTAFQTDAFQNDAFQIVVEPGAQDSSVGDVGGGDSQVGSVTVTDIEKPL